jgi:hypothetical protein
MATKGTKIAQDSFGFGSTTFHLSTFRMFYSAKIKLSSSFFFFLVGLENAKQALYLWVTSPAHFDLVILEVGLLKLFAQAGHE